MTRLHWLLPPALGGLLFAVSLFGVGARHAPGAALVFLGLYLTLGFGLHFLLVVGRHGGRATGYLAALTVGMVLVWQVRELTQRPGSLLAVPAIAVILALPAYRIAVGAVRHLGCRPALIGLAITVVLGGGGLTAAARGSNLLRWHLLRHHKMLGTPYYYLLEPGVATLEERLFAVAAGGSEGFPADPAAGLAADPAIPRPHVVYVMLDTLRADALAMGGGPQEWMPRLNALLSRSYRFTDVVANASWTRPSVASLFTGLQPEAHGARNVDDHLEERFGTLPEVFRELGYETAAFVSNFGAVGRGAGFAQGFDFFLELRDRPYARAGRIRETVRRWLDRRPADPQPLFLYLHFLDPHEPYLSGREPAHRSYDEYLTAYLAELRYLDQELDALLRLLATRLPGPEAVFIASDHGEELGEHEEYGHGYSLYGEVMRIPIAFSTGSGGGEIAAPLEGRDFFDLLARYAATGGHLSVRDWARARRRPSRYYSIYFRTEGHLALRPYLREVCMRAVERDGYKLVWSAYGSTWELYDLTRDPGERHNLAARRPQLVARLAAALEAGVEGWSFPSRYQPSEEEREQLRALGYVD